MMCFQCGVIDYDIRSYRKKKIGSDSNPQLFGVWFEFKESRSTLEVVKTWFLNNILYSSGSNSKGMQQGDNERDKKYVNSDSNQ